MDLVTFLELGKTLDDLADEPPKPLRDLYYLGRDLVEKRDPKDTPKDELLPSRESLVAAFIKRPVGTYKAEPIRWIVRNVIPRDFVTMLPAPPGMGKGVFVAHLVAKLSRGLGLDGMVPPPQPLRTMILAGSGEDDIVHAWLPRLRAAEADTAAVWVVESRWCPVCPDISLGDPDDLAALEERVRAANIDLVVIDSLSAFSRSLSMNRAEDVRSVLDPLNDLAQRLGIAVVMIHHTKKGSTANAAEAGAGSIQLSGAVRSVVVMGYHPSDVELPKQQRRRVIATAKSNYSPTDWSYEFSIGTVPLVDENGAEVLDDAGMGATVPVCHAAAVSDVEADAVTNTEASAELSALDAAQRLIISALQASPSHSVRSAELWEQMQREDVSSATYKRARERLRAAGRIRKDKELGRHGVWCWHLTDAEIERCSPKVRTIPMAQKVEHLEHLAGQGIDAQEDQEVHQDQYSYDTPPVTTLSPADAVDTLAAAIAEGVW